MTFCVGTGVTFCVGTVGPGDCAGAPLVAGVGTAGESSTVTVATARVAVAAADVTLRDPDEESTAPTTCGPAVAFAGIMSDVPKAPWLEVRTVDIPKADPSHCSWIQMWARNPSPARLTDAPGAALPPTVSLGPAALTARNGISRAGTRTTIAIVTSQPRRRRHGRVAGSTCLLRGRSPTQRLPSQNDMTVLPSEARLATRAPWLCGPASRRVCLYGGGRSIAVCPELNETHRQPRSPGVASQRSMSTRSGGDLSKHNRPDRSGHQRSARVIPKLTALPSRRDASAHQAWTAWQGSGRRSWPRLRKWRSRSIRP